MFYVRCSLVNQSFTLFGYSCLLEICKLNFPSIYFRKLRDNFSTVYHTTFHGFKLKRTYENNAEKEKKNASAFFSFSQTVSYPSKKFQFFKPYLFYYLQMLWIETSLKFHPLLKSWRVDSLPKNFDWNNPEKEAFWRKNVGKGRKCL